MTRTKNGKWRGIKYRVVIEECSERCVELRVAVQKNLLRRPGETLETARVSFLGYEWFASLTADILGRIAVFWHLCSPVDERESLRCCFLLRPSPCVISQSCPLKQNACYGGYYEMHYAASNGLLDMHLLFQLITPSEGLTFYQRQSGIYCMLSVRAEKSGYSIRTDRFIWRGMQWGFALHLQEGIPRLLVIRMFPSRDSTGDDISVQAVIFNSSSPDLSYKTQSTKMSRKDGGSHQLGFDPLPQSSEDSEHSSKQEVWLKLSLRLKFSEASSETVEESYLYSWLKYGLRLLFPETPSRSAEESYPLNQPRAAIEVLTDEHIIEHVVKKTSIEVLAAPRRSVYVNLPHQSLNELKQTMQRDAKLDSASSTLWLLCREKSGGVFSKAVCVDALEKFDFRLCELSMKRNLRNNQSIAFYCRPSRDGEVSRDPQGSVLLFCMFLNLQEGKLEFLGSFVVNENSKLQSICYEETCGLYEELKDTEYSFFKLDSAERITQISALSRTMKAGDVASGTTILVRPMVDGEDVSADRVRQELQDLRLNRLHNSATSNAPCLNDHVAHQDTLCVVCQEKPQTSGFYHGETVHVCACEECARRVYDREPRRCPICMEPCTGLVSKIF